VEEVAVVVHGRSSGAGVTAVADFVASAEAAFSGDEISDNLHRSLESVCFAHLWADLTHLTRLYIAGLVTYHVTYHVGPHQPIIDQQGLGLRGLVHKEAHPVIPDLH